MGFSLAPEPLTSEVDGCADAEQGQATGQHRPGGFGEREPGAVGGRGFLVAEGQHGVLDGEEGVGGGDEVPGEPVGRAVVRGAREGARVLGERVQQGLGAGDVHGPGLGREVQPGGAAREGARPRMRVAHAEQRIALTLHEVVGGDPGPVVRGGVQQRPAGGVPAERRGVLPGGHGPQRDGLPVRDLGPPALAGDDPHEGVGDDFGADVVGDAKRDGLFAA